MNIKLKYEYHFSFLPLSQSFPLNPSGHIQVYWLIPSRQVAPLAQSFEKQSSTSVKQGIKEIMSQDVLCEDGLINMTQAWDKEKFWVPGRNRTHALPNSGPTLHPLSYEILGRAKSFNHLTEFKMSCVSQPQTLPLASWTVFMESVYLCLPFSQCSPVKPVWQTHE